MDIKAHWQAIYDEIRAGLDGAGYSAVPIFHVASIDTQTGEGATAPFVIYRQDVERSTGTMGGGEQKVMKSGWVITSYAFDLNDGLDYLTAAKDEMATGIADTSDGYVTTAVEFIGIQTLHEPDFQVYGSHLRMLWERSL